MTQLVITGATQELLRNDVTPMVIDFLADRELMLSPEKAWIVNIKQRFDFLGQNIRQLRVSYAGSVSPMKLAGTYTIK
ncbi:hypothetical protein VLI03_004766 [Salmonella enterica]|nr:hypothetical protein [Salmonella enterica]